MFTSQCGTNTLFGEKVFPCIHLVLCLAFDLITCHSVCVWHCLSLSLPPLPPLAPFQLVVHFWWSTTVLLWSWLRCTSSRRRQARRRSAGRRPLRRPCLDPPVSGQQQSRPHPPSTRPHPQSTHSSAVCVCIANQSVTYIAPYPGSLHKESGYEVIMCK